MYYCCSVLHMLLHFLHPFPLSKSLSGSDTKEPHNASADLCCLSICLNLPCIKVYELVLARRWWASCLSLVSPEVSPSLWGSFSLSLLTQASLLGHLGLGFCNALWRCWMLITRSTRRIACVRHLPISVGLLLLIFHFLVTCYFYCSHSHVWHIYGPLWGLFSNLFTFLITCISKFL